MNRREILKFGPAILATLSTGFLFNYLSGIYHSDKNGNTYHFDEIDKITLEGEGAGKVDEILNSLKSSRSALWKRCIKEDFKADRIVSFQGWWLTHTEIACLRKVQDLTKKI